MKKALVLCGGSVKGAYQAGVVRAIAESGFEPDAVYGISAGSMNATFLANHLGKQFHYHQKANFKLAAADLCTFWLEHINQPDTLARRRGTYELGLSALRRNFEGLLDTQPLRDLLSKNVQIKYLRKSPVSLKIGAVDVTDGRILYIDPSFNHFLDYVMASSAIPILMPTIQIGGNPKMAFLDGGLREVAPIRKAIEDGYDDIVCVACHTSEIEGGAFPYGNLLALVDRVMDIAVNETLNNDIELAQRYFEKKTEGKLTVIRPKTALLVDIQNFNVDDINRLLEIGYHLGQEVM